MKKLFALAAVALTLCGLLTACGSKTETANDVDLTGFYNALAEQYGWGDDMMDLDGEMLEMYYPGLGDIPAKQLLAKAPVMSYAVSEYVFLQVDSEQDAAQAAKKSQYLKKPSRPKFSNTLSATNHWASLSRLRYFSTRRPWV